MAALTDLGIAEARNALAKGEISSVDLTRASLAAMERHRGLNAFITETPELALAGDMMALAWCLSARPKVGAALVAAGVDLVVLDTAHGHSDGVLRAVAATRAAWGAHPRLAILGHPTARRLPIFAIAIRAFDPGGGGGEGALGGGDGFGVGQPPGGAGGGGARRCYKTSVVTVFEPIHGTLLRVPARTRLRWR